MNIPGSFSTGFSESKDLGGGFLSNEKPTFEFGAGPYRAGQFQVSSFTGTEGLSELYDFEVIVAARNYDEITLAALILGQSAHLSLTLADGTQRTIHGILAGYGHQGVFPADGATKMWMRLVPKMWTLTQKKNSRIFQGKRIDEIIKAILEEGGVEYAFKLTRKYPVREYCVQYQETDYDFVARLAAEEGIFFYFEQPNGLIDTAMGMADGLAEKAANAIGGVGGALLGVAEGAALDEIDKHLPAEKVVFADHADAYPAMPSSALEVTGEIMGAIGGTLPAALGSLGVNLTAGPTLLFRDAEGMDPSEAHVFEFELKRSIKPKLTALHDWDFKRPTLAKHAAAQTDANPLLKLPSLQDIGGSVTASLSASLSYSPTSGLHVGAAGHVKADLELPPRLDPRKFEIYDHESDDHREHDVTKADAQVQLEQHRRKQHEARGASWCRTMQPGHRFTLDEHVTEKLNGEYVLTKVRHIGRVPDAIGGESITMSDEEARASGVVTKRKFVYENKFRAVSAKTAFRPKRPDPKERQQILETAIVVGPENSEIHTDEYGRIKVQFHWDREGHGNEHSSVWIRVAHAWAGTAWGFQFIPRVGMEVLVSFLGGSTDRPVVIGCLMNATHPPTFPVPVNKTRSGIRTQSTPGGGGYNELQFEDQKDAEQISIRAQRDFHTLVLNDHDITVQHDHSVNVGGNFSLSVGGTISHEYKKDHVLAIDGSFQERSGDRLQTVFGTLKAHVSGSVLRDVQGSHRLIVGGDDLAYVTGNRVRVIKGSDELQITKEHQINIGEKGQETFHSLYVWGDYRARASKTMLFNAPESITLQCGDSTIVMEPKKITMKSEQIFVTGTKEIMQVAKGPYLHMTDGTILASDTVKVYAKDTSIEMKSGTIEIDGKNVKAITAGGSVQIDASSVKIAASGGGGATFDAGAKVMGATIALGSSASAGSQGNGSDSKDDPKDQNKDPETQPIKITVKDEELEPYKSKKYELRVGEQTIKGTTTADGLVDEKVPKEATKALLTVWVDGDPPTGQKLEFELDLTATLKPASDLEGALTRLMHLGYYAGPLDIAALTDEARAAFRWFQRDHDVPQTGENDSDTQGKLTDEHGS